MTQSFDQWRDGLDSKIGDKIISGKSEHIRVYAGWQRTTPDLIGDSAVFFRRGQFIGEWKGSESGSWSSR